MHRTTFILCFCWLSDSFKLNCFEILLWSKVCYLMWSWFGSKLVWRELLPPETWCGPTSAFRTSLISSEPQAACLSKGLYTPAVWPMLSSAPRTRSTSSRLCSPGSSAAPCWGTPWSAAGPNLTCLPRASLPVGVASSAAGPWLMGLWGADRGERRIPLTGE